MNPSIKNLFAGPHPTSAHEDFLVLFESENVRVERIASSGQCSPKDYWYDQKRHEWVVLLQGTATLQFEDGCMVSLKAGDYLSMARHTKHRVDETSSDALWLAVHHA